MRNLGRPDNRELGYIDAEMPKYVNKEGGQGQNGMHIFWDMKLITKSVKCFLSKNTPNICNGTRDGRKEFKNLTWKLEILQRTVKQLKKPLPKRTRNVRKSKRTQLSTSSLTESPPSDNGDFPSTKLSPRSYSRALKDDPNMSKEQRETRGMFKNLGQVLHNFARMLKKGCL
ncbi:hypothetical protein Tco_0391233 [Tanacetum coccineum]